MRWKKRSVNQKLDRRLAFQGLESRCVLASLASGMELIDSVELRGEDRYDFEATAGNLIQVSVGDISMGSESENTAESYLEIIDPAGNLVSTFSGPDIIVNNRGGNQSRVQLIAATSGTYQAVVSEHGSDQTLDYRIRLLTFPSAIDLDSGSETGRDRELMDGEETDASLPPAGINIHPFTAEAGGAIQLLVGNTLGDSLLGGGSSNGRAAPLVQVVDPLGNLIPVTGTSSTTAEMDNSHSAPQLLRYQASVSGNYTAIISEQSNQLSLQYRIRLLTFSDSFNPISGRDVALGNGDEVRRDVPGSSFNVHTFSVQEGDQVQLSLSAIEEDSSARDGETGLEANATAKKPQVLLYGPGGALLSTGAAAGRLTVDTTEKQTHMSLIAPATGSYTAVVMNQLPLEAIPYQLRFLSLPGTSSEPLNLIEGRDQVLISDEVVQSMLPTGGLAVFPMELTAGDKPQITVANANDGDDSRIDLSVYNPNGDQVELSSFLNSQDDDSVSGVLFDGVYYLVLTTTGNTDLITLNVTASGITTPLRDVNLTVDQPEVSEESEEVSFVLTLSAPAAFDVIVPYAISTSEEALETTIPAGQSSKRVTVSFDDDSVPDVDEVLVVTLSQPGNARLGDSSSGQIIIRDNDAPVSKPMINFDSSVKRVYRNDDPVQISVTLSSPTTNDVAVSLNFSTKGLEFSEDNLVDGKPTLFFPAGQVASTISFKLTGGETEVADATAETEERIVVLLATSRFAELGPNDSLTLLLSDPPADSDLPVIQFEKASDSISEDSASKPIRVALSAPSPVDIIVPVSVTGNATSGDDYQILDSQIVILAGQTKGEVILTTFENTDQDGNKTISLALGEATGVNLGAIATSEVTIIDNETATTGATVNFDLSNAVFNESDGVVEIMVNLSSVVSDDVVIPYRITPNDVQSDDALDFISAKSPLVIPAGNLSGTIRLGLIQDDSNQESDESFELQLGQPVNASLGAASSLNFTIQNSVSNGSAEAEQSAARTNPLTRTDTNADGATTAMDALTIMNYLDRQTGGEAEPNSVRDATIPVNHFYDVNDDGNVTANDALIVINQLQIQHQQIPESIAVVIPGTLASGIDAAIIEMMSDDDDDRKLF